MDYSEYYRTCFRDDLRRFMMSIPADSRHHNGNTEFTIQIYTLWKESPYLDVVPAEHHANFAVALYFTILLDEVFYKHYQPHYTAFRALTQYPRLIGNCLGGCSDHVHPAEIFSAINARGGGSVMTRANVNVSDVFQQAIPVMKEEVMDFFENHMPSIDAQWFWSDCLPNLNLRPFYKLII
jgi:hypothetical protein